MSPYRSDGFAIWVGLCSPLGVRTSYLTIFNTLRPRQNGRHFADDTFKCIFLNKNIWILLKISPKSVPKFRINNIPALVQIMLGADQATSHYLEQWSTVPSTMARQQCCWDARQISEGLRLRYFYGLSNNSPKLPGIITKHFGIFSRIVSGIVYSI